MKKLFILMFLLVLPVFGQNHSVTLTWSWSQGTGDPATGFHVQRSNTTGGPYTIVATVGLTPLDYVDTAVIAGQTYYYVVTAYNPGGDSALSNQVTCTIPFSVPAAPSGLTGVVK